MPEENETWRYGNHVWQKKNFLNLLSEFRISQKLKNKKSQNTFIQIFNSVIIFPNIVIRIITNFTSYQIAYIKLIKFKFSGIQKKIQDVNLDGKKELASFRVKKEKKIDFLKLNNKIISQLN